MLIRILHSADIHLGMKFTRGYAPDVQERLIQARFQTLQSVIDIANEQDCDLFVIAGDLFDNLRVPKKDVVRAAAILHRFEGRLVLVLPGNHDYIHKGDDRLWAQFREAMSEHTLLLEDQRVYDLRPYDLDMFVYAAPCAAKHSNTNALGWMHEIPKDKNIKHHLGIAHGSLEGLSPDFDEDYYPMSTTELNSLGLDLWLMGHTHVRWPDVDTGSEARIFFASTPEPDGFHCAHSGYAWLIDLEEDKSIRYRSIQTGRYRFLTLEAELIGDDDVQALKSRFHRLDSERHLVKLQLRGRVPQHIYDERSTLLEQSNTRVLHLEADLSKLFREITLEDIDREFTQESFPHKLLITLAQEHRNPLSLQMAYELIQEARP